MCVVTLQERSSGLDLHGWFLTPGLRRWFSKGVGDMLEEGSAAEAAEKAMGGKLAIKIFKHTSDFDQNGLLYYLGTKGVQNNLWQNPHKTGWVMVDMESFAYR